MAVVPLLFAHSVARLFTDLPIRLWFLIAALFGVLSLSALGPLIILTHCQAIFRRPKDSLRDYGLGLRRAFELMKQGVAIERINTGEEAVVSNRTREEVEGGTMSENQKWYGKTIIETINGREFIDRRILPGTFEDSYQVVKDVGTTQEEIIGSVLMSSSGWRYMADEIERKYVIKKLREYRAAKIPARRYLNELKREVGQGNITLEKAEKLATKYLADRDQYPKRLVERCLAELVRKSYIRGGITLEITTEVAKKYHIDKTYEELCANYLAKNPANSLVKIEIPEEEISWTGCLAIIGIITLSILVQTCGA